GTRTLTTYTRNLHDALPIYCGNVPWSRSRAHAHGLRPTRPGPDGGPGAGVDPGEAAGRSDHLFLRRGQRRSAARRRPDAQAAPEDRKSTRLNSSHVKNTYAV